MSIKILALNALRSEKARQLRLEARDRRDARIAEDTLANLLRNTLAAFGRVFWTQAKICTLKSFMRVQIQELVDNNVFWVCNIMDIHVEDHFGDVRLHVDFQVMPYRNYITFYVNTSVPCHGIQEL